MSDPYASQQTASPGVYYAAPAHQPHRTATTGTYRQGKGSPSASGSTSGAVGATPGDPQGNNHPISTPESNGPPQQSPSSHTIQTAGDQAAHARASSRDPPESRSRSGSSRRGSANPSNSHLDNPQRGDQNSPLPDAAQTAGGRAFDAQASTRDRSGSRRHSGSSRNGSAKSSDSHLENLERGDQGSPLPDAQTAGGPATDAQASNRKRSRSRGRSGSRSRSAKTGNSYFDKLHSLLEHYDLFASTSARFEQLTSFPTNMKKNKRTFILRSKTEHGKAEELGKFTNPNGVGAAGDRYNYDQKYPADEPEQGCGPTARVWRVYLDEAGQFDLDMVENIRDTVDVILVFAGLFSAIVSTLVSQASTALQLDYAQVTAALMMELIAVQRAIAIGSSLDGVNPSPLNTNSLDSATSSTSDRWVNGLWFTSLAFSLSTALIAVLIKQWIQAYVAPTFGTPREQAYMRQFRFMGIEQWQVPLIVGLLPTLLHISLFVFFTGLVVFLLALDQRIAWVVGGIGITAFLAYAITNLLPLWCPQCPYKTPISNYSLVLSQIIGRFIYIPPFVPQFGRTLVWQFSTIFYRVQTTWRNLAASQFAQSLKSVYKRRRDSGKQIQRSPNKLQTLKDMESQAVKEDGEKLGAHIFNWMCHTSSNPTVQIIVNHAVSELPHETQPSTRKILRQVVLPRICDAVNLFCWRHDRAGEEHQVPLPDEAQGLCDLLSAHVNATRSTSWQHPFNGYTCKCSFPLSEVLDKVHCSPHLVEHPLVPFTHSFHHYRHLQALDPSDLLAFRSSCKSRHTWLSILRHQVAAEKHHSTLEYSTRWPAHPWKDGPPALSTWWTSAQPILDILFAAGSEDVFTNIEKILLSAYLFYYTRPAALQADDHEHLEVALWHTDTLYGLDLWSNSVCRAVSHYVARVYIHTVAIQSVHPAIPQDTMPMDRKHIDWDLLRTPRMADGIHTLPYFLPSPAVFAEMVHSNKSSATGDKSQLVLLLLELMWSIMEMQNSLEVCDTFHDNDCLKVLELVYQYLHKHDNLDEHERETIASIAGDYLRVVAAQSDTVWQQKHLDEVFRHVDGIIDRWLQSVYWTAPTEMPVDIRILVEIQPHRPEWSRVILKLQDDDEEYHGPQCAKLLRAELIKAGRTDPIPAPPPIKPATALGRARQTVTSTVSRLQSLLPFRRARTTQPTDVEMLVGPRNPEPEPDDSIPAPHNSERTRPSSSSYHLSLLTQPDPDTEQGVRESVAQDRNAFARLLPFSDVSSSDEDLFPGCH